MVLRDTARCYEILRGTTSGTARHYATTSGITRYYKILPRTTSGVHWDTTRYYKWYNKTLRGTTRYYELATWYYETLREILQGTKSRYWNFGNNIDLEGKEVFCWKRDFTVCVSSFVQDRVLLVVFENNTQNCCMISKCVLVHCMLQF